jgi:hypothetical protein
MLEIRHTHFLEQQQNYDIRKWKARQIKWDLFTVPGAQSIKVYAVHSHCLYSTGMKIFWSQ